MKGKLKAKCIEILADCPDMTIATTRPDGSPQATVVSFVHDGLVIYFGCGPASQKATNIARDPRVSITVTEPYRDWQSIRGLSMGAIATEVKDATELASVGRLMVRRFPQLATMSPAEAAAMKVFRVTPTVVSILDYALGFGHTDLVAVSSGDIADMSASMRHNWIVRTPVEGGTPAAKG